MKDKVNIDIIILSYAKDDYLKGLTEQTISTLMDSEDPEKIHFNILVIESNKALAPYQFGHSTTIYPTEKFGFHKYLNIGINMTGSPFVCLCNNDLIFHKNWASEIVKAMENDPEMLSATPYCPNFHKKEGFAENVPPLQGYFGLLVGWCIFVRREIFGVIGPLDENLVFWYCDYDYCNTLEKFKVKNCLVSTSYVTHLGSESIELVDKKEHKKLTQIPRFYFSYKWHHHSYIRYKLETWLFKLKLFLNL
ncbi:MAG TPA: glycosyltransferase [Mucilaginibacter sp.]|nr:glycosyltransferase [Mucilaginibacter sp.]